MGAHNSPSKLKASTSQQGTPSAWSVRFAAGGPLMNALLFSAKLLMALFFFCVTVPIVALAGFYVGVRAALLATGLM